MKVHRCAADLPSQWGKVARQHCGAASPLPPGSLIWETHAERCSVWSRAIPDHCWLWLSSCFRRDVSFCITASFPGHPGETTLQPLRRSCPCVTPISCALHLTLLAVRWFIESLGLCLGQSFPKAAGLGPATDRSLRSAMQQQGRSCSLPRGFSGAAALFRPSQWHPHSGDGKDAARSV